MNEEIENKKKEIENQERVNLKYSKTRWYNMGLTNLEKLKQELIELENMDRKL